MTADDIIVRLRSEIDKIYETYEGNVIVEEDYIMSGFENIINDYYEDLSPI